LLFIFIFTTSLLWLLKCGKIYTAYNLSLFFWWDWVWTQHFALEKQVLYCISHTSSSFCFSCFGNGVSQIICQGWLQTVILPLPISASQVARIIDMSHRVCNILTIFLCTVFWH
jgi:hypothetical protein